MFCSTAAAPVGTYVAGTCYDSECLSGNTDCAAMTKTCQASDGTCVDIPCTTINDAACALPKTGVCDLTAVPTVCGTCTVTPGVSGAADTSDCATGSWCATSGTNSGACYLGECTAANQDTTCTTLTTACNVVTLVCEQQVCPTGQDDECRTGLCTAATVNANCKACTLDSECQAAGAGSQTTRYCNVTSGGCFTETCTGPVSDPVVATDSCTDFTQNCVNGACAA